MVRSHKLRLFGAVFSLTLALVLGAFSYATFAVNRGSSFFVFGPSTATCARTGATVPAGFQGSTFGTELQGYWDDEPVFISFTFPDGRVFSPVVTGPGTVNTPIGLDGVIDMPDNFPWVFNTSDGGDYYFTFTSSNKWPYGCYSFTALGARSNRQASADFVIAPRVGAAPNPGPANLVVQDNTTGDPSSLHGALVDIFGRGFLGQEVISVWITTPDGTVVDYPQQQASDIGSFASTFVFDANYPTGQYAFTALGTRSGYQVITRFNLASRPSAPSGWAQLRVAQPFPANVDQRTRFEVQGKRFDPYERVDVWITLPDGGVRGLPSQLANEFGEFFAVVDLDERLPTGEYDFTAKGANSGRLVVTTLNVTAGSPNVTDTTPDLNPVPQVDANNSGVPETLGPSDNQGELPVLDPEPEPTF